MPVKRAVSTGLALSVFSKGRPAPRKRAVSLAKRCLSAPRGRGTLHVVQGRPSALFYKVLADWLRPTAQGALARMSLMVIVQPLYMAIWKQAIEQVFK